MPELPEVETVRRGLERFLKNKTIHSIVLNRADLRFPMPAQLRTFKNIKVSAFKRRAKYLLLELDNGWTILSHLGMSGKYIIDEALPFQPDNKHDHIVFHICSCRLRYNDPRRFGFIDLFKTGSSSRFLAEIGPEPLAEDFDHRYLKGALASKKAPIKAALLDQRVVAGLGNIYVCEALYLSGIDPKKPACEVLNHEVLAQNIKEILQRAIEAGGSTLKDYAKPEGDFGYFQHQFDVYGREGAPCPACSQPILRITQSGRSTFYCKRCQT